MPRDKDVKRVVRKRMAETGERYTEARAAIRPRAKRGSLKGKPRTDESGPQMVQVEIPVHGGVRVQMSTGQHYVVMKELDGTRELPIWIGIAEANAIAVRLTRWKVERPLTADLMASTIATLGGEVERVVITRVEFGCFFAEVHVRRDGIPLEPMDARPSDALGIAVRTQAPIFVAAEVMDAFGSELEPLPDGVTIVTPGLRTQGAADTPPTMRELLPRPTHVLVDVASERAVTHLLFPRDAVQPAVDTLMTVGTPLTSVQYRIVEVEPQPDGITTLRAEVVSEPTQPSSHIVTVAPQPSG